MPNASRRFSTAAKIARLHYYSGISKAIFIKRRDKSSRGGVRCGSPSVFLASYTIAGKLWADEERFDAVFADCKDRGDQQLTVYVCRSKHEQREQAQGYDHQNWRCRTILRFSTDRVFVQCPHDILPLIVAGSSSATDRRDQNRLLSA